MINWCLWALPNHTDFSSYFLRATYKVRSGTTKPCIHNLVYRKRKHALRLAASLHQLLEPGQPLLSYGMKAEEDI